MSTGPVNLMITEATRASKGGRILASYEECLDYLAAPDCPCFAPDDGKAAAAAAAAPVPAPAAGTVVP